MSCSDGGEQDCCSGALSRLQVSDDKDQSKELPRSKGEIRGSSEKGSGLTHECGVFGCVAAGDWPSNIDVGQVICLGKSYLWKFLYTRIISLSCILSQVTLDYR